MSAGSVRLSPPASADRGKRCDLRVCRAVAVHRSTYALPSGSRECPDRTGAALPSFCVTPHLKTGVHVDKLNAQVAGERLVSATRQPLYAGARALLARCYNPAVVALMRHADSAVDSFRAMAVSGAAKWTVEGSDRSGLRRHRWVPLQDAPRLLEGAPRIAGRGRE